MAHDVWNLEEFPAMLHTKVNESEDFRAAISSTHRVGSESKERHGHNGGRGSGRRRCAYRISGDIFNKDNFVDR